MFGKKICRWGVLLAFFFMCNLVPAAAHAARFKVLMVLGYGASAPWGKAIQKGAESVLAQTCKMRYFHMDTEEQPEAAREKAKEAHELYQKFQPDGVIAVNDDAQSFFVVPYLAGKVRTPVMFCAIRKGPEAYGYPASNVSGILERYHIAESIAFAQQLLPSVRTFGLIQKDSDSGRAVLKQIYRESDHYVASFADFKLPNTLEQAVTMTEMLRSQCDILFTLSMDGIYDDKDQPLTDADVLPVIAKAFGKPLVSGNAHNVSHGILCAVAKSGQEQGKAAGEMLLKAMKGTPISKLPISQNRHGRRMVNTRVMKALDITPPEASLQGAELVETGE